ncbi:MAG: hypothetical protein KGL67_00745 [Patescibacteria group bacterium]|nr:hypothetical protein [Patescibacteria group bacterium]
MKEKKYVYVAMALLAVTTLIGSLPVLADNNDNTQTNNPPSTFGVRGMMEGRGDGREMMKPAVYGTVSAISVNTITVNSIRGFGTNAVTTTYTVDATNAKIFKDKVAGTISSIVVGDTIVAQGTLTGTNLVATIIRDGKLNMGTIRGGRMGEKNGSKGTNTPLITGNGQPIVAGTVTAISGSSITITNKSNVTYTIDATNAKITRGPNVIAVSGVAVGDMVIAQGTINGNAVVATSVIDQTKIANTNSGDSGEQSDKGKGGFFGGIGSFFAHLFGF